MHDKESRLKRLAKGLRPYFKYTYHIKVLGPATSWMNKERPGSGAADEGDIADYEGGPGAPCCGSLLILGQVADSRVSNLLQEQECDVPECLVPAAGEQAWHAKNPFGLGGDLDQ